MSDFLLLCVKFFCFMFVLIIVIGEIKVQYDKKNKIKKEEKNKLKVLSQSNILFHQYFLIKRLWMMYLK